MIAIAEDRVEPRQVVGMPLDHQPAAPHCGGAEAEASRDLLLRATDGELDTVGRR